MNKTAIKNFAIWARTKLIADVSYKAGLMGITSEEISDPLPQSTDGAQFYDIGTKEPYCIAGKEIRQRKSLVDLLNERTKQSGYLTAYNSVIEEVAYTWFNRLVAIRFMEVNDYLPSHIRVLTSESGTAEPDLVRRPFDADLKYADDERSEILKLQDESRTDELFNLLFIKQCNALNAILPGLFEKTDDHTELLFSASFTDPNGIVAHLVTDIEEDDFKEAVEIIGWLYQYYNTEPKQEVFDGLKKNVKISKEKIPAATQLFTPDWIVRYMVENSLGRLWVEHLQVSKPVILREVAESTTTVASDIRGNLSNNQLPEIARNWKYYLDEAEQEPEVQAQLETIRATSKDLSPEDIKLIDPCMGSGHILVYAFDVLIQIYESAGYATRDAAKLIVEKNLYGLDIDERAYQLAYFAVMMKARQYSRRILNEDIDSHIYAIKESNSIDRNHLQYFGADIDDAEKNTALKQVEELLDDLIDAREYGSILRIKDYNWELLNEFVNNMAEEHQISIDTYSAIHTQKQLRELISISEVLSQKYDVVCTNPPYMGSSGMNPRLAKFVKDNYPDSKSDLFAAFMEHGLQMINPNGNSSMVTMQSWMFLSSFETMRKRILKQKTIINLMHMENIVMGIAFGTAVANIQGLYIQGYQGNYNHVTMNDIADEKPIVFPPVSKRNVTVASDNFEKIPGSPVAYWATKSEYDIFYEAKSLSKSIKICQGMKTADNDRFLRYWYEINCNNSNQFNEVDENIVKNRRWCPYNKGGDYRKWYGNRNYVVDWQNNGAKIKSFEKSVIRNERYFFKESLTWSLISSSNFGIRYSPVGSIFDGNGSSMFANTEELYYILGFLCSKVTIRLLLILSATMTFEIGQLSKLPSIIADSKKMRIIKELVKQNITYSRTDWDSFETSWDFKTHPLI